MTVQATNYDGSKSYNIVLDTDIKPETWKSLGSSSSKYCKSGNIVFIVCSTGAQSPKLVKNSYTLIGTLPSGYRPSHDVMFRVSGQGSGLWTDVGKISTNGTVEIFHNDLSDSQSIYYAYFVCFPVGN